LTKSGAAWDNNYIVEEPMKKNAVLILLYVGCLALSAAFFFARAGGSIWSSRNPVLLADDRPT
jgi:hypothetical protein